MHQSAHKDIVNFLHQVVQFAGGKVAIDLVSDIDFFVCHIFFEKFFAPPLCFFLFFFWTFGLCYVIV